MDTRHVSQFKKDLQEIGISDATEQEILLSYFWSLAEIAVDYIRNK